MGTRRTHVAPRRPHHPVDGAPDVGTHGRELTLLLNRLHDSYFDLPDDLPSQRGTVELHGHDDLSRELRARRTLGPFSLHEVWAPAVTLIIHGVTSVAVDDFAEIGAFDLDEGHYSRADGALTITSGVPVTIRLQVDRLHVDAVHTGRMELQRIRWGLRRRAHRTR